MAKRNRQTWKKREREMAKKQKQQEKAERIATRKDGRRLQDGFEAVNRQARTVVEDGREVSIE